MYIVNLFYVVVNDFCKLSLSITVSVDKTSVNYEVKTKCSSVEGDVYVNILPMDK